MEFITVHGSMPINSFDASALSKRRSPFAPADACVRAAIPGLDPMRDDVHVPSASSCGEARNLCTRGEAQLPRRGCHRWWGRTVGARFPFPKESLALLD